MQQTKRWLERAVLLCDEFGPEDGIDSRLLSRTLMNEKQSYKGRQLCKTAKRTLSLVLGGEFSDPLLQRLVVIDVTSSEAGESLSILLCHQDGESAVDTGQILHKLNGLQGALRATIARSVKRKRVPGLRFKLVQTESEENSHAYF